MARDVNPIRASAAATTSGTTAAIRNENGDELAVEVDVTAVTGTGPSMTVSVEWSHDGTTWFTGDPPDVFTAITAVGKKVKEFDMKGPWYRVAWAITGTTPSFTFALTAWVN